MRGSLRVFVLLIVLTGIAHGWLGSASRSCVKIYRWSSGCLAASEGHGALNTVPKRNLAFRSLGSIFSTDIKQPSSPSNIANKHIDVPLNEGCMGLGRGVLSRRSAFLLSLPLIFGAASSASANTHTTNNTHTGIDKAWDTDTDTVTDTDTDKDS